MDGWGVEEARQTDLDLGFGGAAASASLQQEAASSQQSLSARTTRRQGVGEGAHSGGVQVRWQAGKPASGTLTRTLVSWNTF